MSIRLSLEVFDNGWQVLGKADKFSRLGVGNSATPRAQNGEGSEGGKSLNFGLRLKVSAIPKLTHDSHL
jgi:hypothetical protein